MGDFKKQKKPVKLFTCDTETRGLFGELVRVGLYDGANYWAFDTFNEVMDILNTYDNTENHIYIHNLDFDIAKVAPELFNRENIDFGNSIFINGNAVTVATKRFVLHDSYRLLASSLDKLCKDFELKSDAKKDLTEYIKEKGWDVYNKKGEYDKKESLGNFFMRVDSDDPVYNEYLKYDCISLYKIIQIVCELSDLSLDEIIFCPTTASLAMKVYRVNNEEMFDKITSYQMLGARGNFIEEFLRWSYYGGRVEVFTPYMENGFHYDVNSLYPYVMENCKFPYGNPVIHDGKESEKAYKAWKLRGKGAGFLHCKVDIPDTLYIPPLPHRDPSGKLLFPVGKLEGIWPFPEVLEAELMGCTIEEYHTCVFYDKTDYIFSDFVSHFKEIKIHSKGAKKTFAKLMQNSLYGKFGQKRKRTSYADMDKLIEILDSGEPYHVHHHTANMVNVKFIEYVSESKAKYIQPQIAAYVTSLARIVLMRSLIKQHKKGNVAYCDTDSIAGTAEMEDEEIDSTEYGKWDLEGIIAKGIFLQPKFYAEKMRDGTENIKAKGVPKAKQAELSFTDFENWLEIIKEGKQEFIPLYENIPSRKKFMNTLKNNEDFDKIILLRKQVNLMMEQKRVMDYNANTTKPHKRYDYGDKKNTPQSGANYFTERLKNMCDDSDSLADDIACYGYLRIPEESTELFQLYQKLQQNTKKKYFRATGVPAEQWIENSGWEWSELLHAMGD